MFFLDQFESIKLLTKETLEYVFEISIHSDKHYSDIASQIQVARSIVSCNYLIGGKYIQHSKFEVSNHNEMQKISHKNLVSS